MQKSSKNLKHFIVYFVRLLNSIKILRTLLHSRKHKHLSYYKIQILLEQKTRKTVWNK